MANSETHSPSAEKSRLAHWLFNVLGYPRVGVKLRLRGNHLHILCEGNVCPDRSMMLHRLLPALQKANLNTLTPAGQPPVYQLCVYGRKIGEPQPTWTVPIDLNQLDRHLEQLPLLKTSRSVGVKRSAQATQTLPLTASALVLTNRSLAKRGQPEGIARYLSETLTALGVAVQVNVKTVPYVSAASVVRSGDAESPVDPTLKRLFIHCEAFYSPDPSVIAEPIAQKLRDLQLEGFRDALIQIQVRGEDKPDWGLRVDLTPPDEMLREWARWGDVGALTRLLDDTLKHLNFHLSTSSLRDSTLHLFCSVRSGRSAHTPKVSSQAVPNQEAIVNVVLPLLETIAPQGIHAATLYGQVEGEEAPAWVKWVDLPAGEHAALSESAMTLAQQGDLDAIAFLLNRLLNPDLDQQLATGGIRIQILQKNDLLHVMTDAPICPDQKQVGSKVTQFLKPFNLPNTSGVRIYGRRAGQSRPLWCYGTDFVTRDRLVPEATPQFAATDAYVGDLITASEEEVLRPDLTTEAVQAAWQTFWQRWVYGIQQTLIRTSLFVPGSEAKDSLPAAGYHQFSYDSTKLAVIWGIAGVLLMVQADWGLNRLLLNVAPQETASQSSDSTLLANSPPTTAAPVASSTLPSPLADASPAAANEETAAQTDETSGVFNTDGFTAPAEKLPQAETRPGQPAAVAIDLPFTPQSAESQRLAAAVLAQELGFSTFNSRQLDEKIALYRERLQESGVPDVLIIGSSRALRGVDPIALQQELDTLGYPDAEIFNFGVNGATAQVVDFILKQVLAPDQLPKLIVWADGARAFNSGNPDVTFDGITASEGYRELAAGTPIIPSSVAASNPSVSLSQGMSTTLNNSYREIDRWFSQRLAQLSSVHGERDRLLNVLQSGVNTILPSQPDRPLINPGTEAGQGEGMVDYDGFLSLAIRYNPATYFQQYARVAGQYDSDYANFRVEGRQATALRSLLELTRTHNISIVFVNLPLTEDYLDPVRLKYEEEFKQYMITQATSGSGFIFRDLGDIWLTQHDYFSDPSHLNRYGAYELSRRLAQDAMVPWVKVNYSQ